jgi:hypothetical protein
MLHTLYPRHIVLHAAAALVCVFSVPFTALAQTRVTPPPLPPGSSLVRVAPGMSPPEADRQIRAHHHKMHVGKDVTREAGVHLDASPSAPAAAAPSSQGEAPVVNAHFGNESDAAPKARAARQKKSGSSKSSQHKSGSQQ